MPQATLSALKATCTTACGPIQKQIAALEPAARTRASAARAVLRARASQADPMAEALGNSGTPGRLRVEPEFLLTLSRAAGSDDPVAAAGAAPEAVALLERADAVHAKHGAALAAAYAETGA